MRSLIPSFPSFPSLFSRRSPLDIFDEMERFFEPTFRTWNQDLFTIQPACDVEETDDKYILSFDVPGVKKQDLKLEIDGNKLLISGERKRSYNGSTEEGTRRSERSYGRFERMLTLPSSVNTEEVEAHYDNGVLQVVLPKVETARARTIEIQEGTGTGVFSKILGSSKKEKESRSEAPH